LEKFEFKLDNILRIRKKIEESFERGFSKKRAELFKIENEIKNNENKYREFIRENGYSSGIFRADEIIAVDNYIKRMGMHIKKLDEIRIGKKEEVNKALHMLNGARKSRKVMEKLKDRYTERYIYDLNREEDNEIDDINQHIGINKEILTIEDIPMEDM